MKVVLLIALVALAGGASQAAVPPHGTLRVQERHVPGGPVFTEGSVWGLQVTLLPGSGRRPLVAFKGELLMQAHLTLTLAPGRYELASYQRPCDGNCDLLDPATDRCRARFSLKTGQRLHAVVSVRDGRPCAIRFVKP